MAFVENQPGHIHVALKSAGVEAVTFFCNQNHVLHVAVPKVSPEVCAAYLLAPEDLDGALHQHLHL